MKVPTLASLKLLSTLPALAFGLFACTTVAQATVAPTIANVNEAVGKTSLQWVPNGGQWDAKAAYRAQSFAGSVWVTHDGALVHQFNGPKVDSPNDESAPGRDGKARLNAVERKAGWVLTERFVGGTVKSIKGRDQQAATANYFLADALTSATDLPSFGELALGEVYPGVSVALKATQANVEKLYTVAAAQSPSIIRMQIDGAKALSVQPDGSLQAATDNGPIQFTPPVAFQFDDAGNRIEVKVAYALDADAARYGFSVGEYDRARPLTIDPLLGSTYFGGTDREFGNAIAINPSSGVVYVAGETFSSDIPGTSGGAQTSKAGSYAAFIARFNSSLTTLLGATYFGGDSYNGANAIAINPNTGNVYIAGSSWASTLPGTAGSPQPTPGANAFGQGDAFVAVFNGALNTLIRSSFHGGTGDDIALAMAYHPTSGQIYIGGRSTIANSLPGLAGGAQSTTAISAETCFVTRFSGDLTQRLQSTYIGGTSGNNCEVAGLAVHPTSGFIYAVGSTNQPGLPGIAFGNQTTFAGGALGSAFVTRLSATLTSIAASTYDSLSNSGTSGYSVAIHPTTGDIYLGGRGSVPFTTGSAQPTGGDGFISRFAANLGSRFIATTVGGSNTTEVRALTFNAVNGDIYGAGLTIATTWSQAAGGVQSGYAGGFTDGFVVRVNAGLTAYNGATYLGTAGDDSIAGIAFNPLNGNVYVAGSSTGTAFPGASTGAQPANAGVTNAYDAFVSAFTPDLSNFGVTPNPFTIKPRLNVIVGTTHIDGPFQMTGLTAFAPVSITGAQGNVCISSTAACTCNLSPSGVWGTSGSIANNQYLCVRAVASAAASTFSEATIATGGYITKFLTYTGQLFNCTMDIDGDGVYHATTDGLLLSRALMGLTGTAVTNGLVGHNPPRNTWALIRDHLNSSCGLNLAQ